MKKKFYAILLTALMLVSVGCGAALATTDETVTIYDPSQQNIAGLYASGDNSFLYSGNVVTSADWPNHYLYMITATSPDSTLWLDGTISPTDSGLTWSYDWAISGDNSTVVVKGWIEGTVASADVLETDKSYTLTVLPYRGTTVVSQTTYPTSAKFTVNIKPTITTATPGDIVWGQEWSFVPSLDIANINDATWSVISSGESLIAASLDAIGLSFDTSTGKLSGTWEPSRAYVTAGSEDIILGSADWDLSDISRDIVLRVTRGSGDKAVSDDEVFTLNFKAGAPVIVSTDKTTSLTDALITEQFATVSTDTRGFMWSEDISSADGVVIVAYGPGLISWDVNGYILQSGDLKKTDGTYGFTYEAVISDDSTSKLYIYGKPTTTASDATITITAANAIDSVSRTATFSIGSDKFTLRAVNYSSDATTASSDAAIPNGNVKVDDTIAEVILIAQPGPVTWTTKNLPAGLVLEDLGNGKASISGKYTMDKPMTDDDTVNYQIIAENEIINSKDILSNDITVWAKPIVTAAIDSKINTKTKYTWSLTGVNFPKYTSWDIDIDGLEETSNGSNKWKVKGGTSCISLDIDSTNKVAKLVGSIDRVPSGGEFTVKVTAENYYGKSEEEEFTVTVAGVKPKMTADSFVLNSKSGDVSVEAGDAPLKMTAVITDTKTLAKLGANSAITLGKKADSYTGLSFTTSGDAGEAYLSYTKPSTGALAYKDLPVLVTATNTAVPTLTNYVTHKLTVTGESPSFVNSNDISEKYCDILKNSTDVPATVTLTVQAGKALPKTDTDKRIVFAIKGAKPLTTTIKPATANGITVATANNDTLLTFTGTPTATKKDVTSKFTITTTNPLTNESKKIVVTVVAKPTPVIDTTKGLEKEVLVGKKVKITPKATVTTTGMKWAISKVSGGSTTGGGTVTKLDELTDQYGLEFDAAKGTISGTALYPTGKDDPILVEFYACDSTGKISSDVATAKITILGAKPKLVTKKMSLETKTPLTSDTGLITTNLSDANESATSSHMIANVELTATTPLPDNVTITNSSNKPTLGGTPSKATKKLATEFKLTNFGTVGKGKITFTVTDAKPAIEAVTTTPSVTVGSSSTVTLKVKDATNADLKYKWKITEKPNVSGISAKVKGNGMYATVTVKANKKVDASTNSSTTLKITVTDPLTKDVSDEFPLTITISDGTKTTNDTELEAGEMKAENKAEAKDIAAVEKEVKDVALGEGEVHMGAGRTADKLTAAQRKAIEDKGYVIAAVLPEIEVTASGQYDFEVDLDKEVKTGAELVWFAFSTKPTTDDEIVDFADEKGEETKVVPESHVVIVAPWLNAEAKYAPVIAVKADAKDADATTAEGVKEAAEAKTEE